MQPKPESMSTDSLDNHSSQVIRDCNIIILKENHFVSSNWQGAKKSINYKGNWPPTSDEDLLGSPAEQEECAICRRQSLCQCDYPAFTNYSEQFYHDAITIMSTEGKGHGLFARFDFEKNRVLGEYTGELVPIDNSRSDEETRYMADITIGQANLTQKGTLAALCRQAKCWIDASRKGSIFRFLNHSCDWNAGLQLARVGMGRRVLMVATTKAIAAGEEITIDYGKDYWKAGETCQCGSKLCRFSRKAS